MKKERGAGTSICGEKGCQHIEAHTVDSYAEVDQGMVGVMKVVGPGFIVTPSRVHSASV